MNILLIIIILVLVCLTYIWIYGPDNFIFYKVYTSNAFEKKQFVRLIDIFIASPFALYLAYKLEQDKKWGIIPYLLYCYAVTTIVFNYSNYYKKRLY